MSSVGAALLGGAMIGVATGGMWLGLGRIAGISGTFGALLTPQEPGQQGWRFAFLTGMLGGAVAIGAFRPEVFAPSPASVGVLALMVSAIAVNAAAVAIGARWTQPVAGGSFHPPPRSPIDGRLLVGASLFGVGWGLSGYCPGPAWVSLVSPNAGLIVFLAAVGVGMLLHDRVWAR